MYQCNSYITMQFSEVFDIMLLEFLVLGVKCISTRLFLYNANRQFDNTLYGSCTRFILTNPISHLTRLTLSKYIFIFIGKGVKF